MHVADAVGPAEIERFWSDGALCVRGLFAEWVEPMRAAIEEALDAPGPLAQNTARRDYSARGHERSGSFFIEQGLWSRHAAFRGFAFDSPAADVAERLLGGEQVNLFFDQLFVKEPESAEQRTPWHQDQAYWPIRGQHVVSVWVPFDRSSRQTGALRYVRGSHLWSERYSPTDFGPKARALADIAGARMPDIDAEPTRYEILSWDLEPGDCLIHHGMTVHASEGNASAGTRRRALSIRFTGDDVRWDPRPGVLERIPAMTTLPLTLADGDRMTCEAFPVARRRTSTSVA
jgi:ectoine hydroxylase-related dioxygenase (phytanoyl-CoA dioxygenase family)